MFIHILEGEISIGVCESYMEQNNVLGKVQGKEKRGSKGDKSQPT
jgi:hypothetical protein